MPFFYIWLTWLAVCSAVAFLMMGYDKNRAVSHCRRVPERTLFTLAWIGGAAGILGGMFCFRHKTLHRSFSVGVPFILLLQGIASGCLFYWFR